jgi:hypothetical protein
MQLASVVLPTLSSTAYLLLENKGGMLTMNGDKNDSLENKGGMLTMNGDKNDSNNDGREENGREKESIEEKNNESSEEKENEINEESSSTASGVGGLSLYLTKSLIRSFEESGDTRQGFDLLGFCDNNTDIYGEKASPLRRQVQYRWNKVKGRSIKAYWTYLKRIQVQAGPVTTAQFRHCKVLKKKKPRNMTTETISSITHSDSDEEYSDEDLDSIASDTLSRATKETASKPPRFIKKRTSRSAHDDDATATTASTSTSNLFTTPPPKKTPPRQKKRTPSAVSASKQDVQEQQHVFGETSNLVGAVAFTTTTQASIPNSYFTGADGSRNHPYTVAINTLHAERNGDFDVEFVNGMDQEGLYSRNGFHIRRTVAVPDHNYWEATIPQGFPSRLSKRLILVRGPSQDYFQRSAYQYHETMKESCNATKICHSATQLAIEEDNERQWKYYLLVFPNDTILDNQVFSKDEHVVPLGKNPITLKSAAANNDFKKDLRAMVLYWRIAVKGGTKHGKQEQKEEISKMFK